MLGDASLIDEAPQDASLLLEDALRLARDIDDPRLASSVLESIAAVDMLTGLQERAVRLFAGAQAVRDRIGAPMSPSELEVRATKLDAARLILGAGFDESWGQGAELDLERLLELVLLVDQD